jgi:uncharacterized membrane protein
MEILLKIFNKNRNTNFALLIFAFYGFALLLVRAKITHSIYLFFLLWNLILAIVPYFITSYITVYYDILETKIKSLILLFIWLLFLPNSFYIITDIVHILNSNKTTLWFDLLLLFSFSILGFMLGMLSLIQYYKIGIQLFSKIFLNFSIPFICFLCGFGIYLGRILRFNSWEIFSNPISLISNIFYTFTTPSALLFSINFGLFIFIIFKIQVSKINP